MLAVLAVKSEAAPARLMENTVRACLTFAAGQAPPTDPAAALAEGVLKTMYATKLKLGALLALVLVAAGVGGGFAFFRPDTPPRQDPPTVTPRAPEALPPLPKAWAGRWIADPFADAVAFEARQNGREAILQIKDPEAVAEVVRAAKIHAVQNNIAAGAIPSAFITVRGKNGFALTGSLISEDQLQCDGGILQLDSGFVDALNQQLSKQEKTKIDLRERLEPPAAAGPSVAPAKASGKSLTAGFTELEVMYVGARTLYRTRITDAKTLDALHKELKILSEGPAPKKHPGNLRSLRIVSKDGSWFNGNLVSTTELFDRDAGWFILTPDFVQALGKEVSRRAGRVIDLLGDNPPTEAQKRRAEECRERFAGVKSIQFSMKSNNKDLTVTADEPREVEQLLVGLRVQEVPAREEKAERRTPLATLFDAKGKKTEIFLVEGGPALESGPVLGDLVEVSGFGQVWINQDWKSNPSMLLFRKEQEAAERRNQETARLVCEDFATFLRHVRNLEVFYRDKGQIRAAVNEQNSRPVLRALAEGKLEKLDWDAERWRKEEGDLIDREAGEILLVPGLGFSLPLVVRGEKELLLPGYGRLVFEKSPLETIQKAVDDGNPRSVVLLPGEKKDQPQPPGFPRRERPSE
jgi:hypothetical protein